jgi:hypothetical protein
LFNLYHCRLRWFAALFCCHLLSVSCCLSAHSVSPVACPASKSQSESISSTWFRASTCCFWPLFVGAGCSGLFARVCWLARRSCSRCCASVTRCRP